jgi:hypothetical protein
MYKFRKIKVNNLRSGFYDNERNVAFGDVMCTLVTNTHSNG